MINLLGTLIITAYLATGHRCANGHWPIAGVSCAADRSIPLGTWLEIEGVGRRRVDDRINPRFHGTRIDLFFGPRNRQGAAKAWGAQPHHMRIIGPIRPISPISKK